MSVFELLKEFKNGFKRGLYRNIGFPVTLNGSFAKFMADIKAGDCYVALDLNILVNPKYHLFTEDNRYVRFLVSEHTMTFFRNSIEKDDEYSEMATYALNTINQAAQEGFNVSVIDEVSEEMINHLGFDISFPAAIICSFYQASIEVEQTHRDCRRLFFVTLPTEEDSISIANMLGLPTYVIREPGR